MSSRLVLRAPAKINLGLTVLGKRADGFHEIETIMQQITLADYLSFEPLKDKTIRLVSTVPDLENEENLVYRAARLLQARAASETILPGVKITLYKNIPIAAGLAGGSSDAACALKGLNNFWQLGLTKEKLMQIGAELGSDIPFCLKGGTCLARGRGEILEALPKLPFFWVVLALPPGMQISTAEAYANFNRQLMGKPVLSPLIEAVRRRDRQGLLQWLATGFVNTLETVEFPAAKELRGLKNRLRAYGLHPVLSGSGPSLFMFFESFSDASQAARAAEAVGAKSYLCWT